MTEIATAFEVVPTVSVAVNANVVVAPAAQTPTTTTTTTTTTPVQTLPQTGSSTPGLVGIGGALTMIGWVVVRLARRAPGLSH